MRNKSPNTGSATGIDNYDMAILSALSENAELTTIELSKLVHLSRTAVARRITNLRDRGVISPATVDIDYSKLGFAIRAFMEVSAPDCDSFRFRDEILQKPEVLNCSFVLGEHMVILEIIAVDTNHLHQFLTWIYDRGFSETKIILQSHRSSIAFRERMKMIEAARAEPDPRLAVEAGESSSKALEAE